MFSSHTNAAFVALPGIDWPGWFLKLPALIFVSLEARLEELQESLRL